MTWAFPQRGDTQWAWRGSPTVSSRKQDNCQVAVSLSVATWEASLPVAWRLYLPTEWAEDRARRKRAGVPEEVGFQTKPDIAVGMIGKALEEGVPVGVVLAAADYGSDTRFRESLEELGLSYVSGVQGNVSLRRQGKGPHGAKFRLSNLPEQTPLAELVRLAKHRWIVERDSLELKQELGLEHFEGRPWLGFHHHAPSVSEPTTTY